MAAKTVMVVMGSHFLTKAYEAPAKQEKYQGNDEKNYVHVKPPADHAQHCEPPDIDAKPQDNAATKRSARAPKSACRAKRLLPMAPVAQRPCQPSRLRCKTIPRRSPYRRRERAVCRWILVFQLRSCRGSLSTVRFFSAFYSESHQIAVKLQDQSIKRVSRRCPSPRQRSAVVIADSCGDRARSAFARTQISSASSAFSARMEITKLPPSGSTSTRAICDENGQ